ncbi:hypothetical protein LAZ67_13002987 [Cordylochernes scorpioides]|uniref:VWFA domain-containing protein n=1 Tax=Cordylochernes scorpioides TaxID=51811 RepID=A0ABY6L6V6_9ARAC|nr:hypothetical protein LAZ67_13002987 [Cordylochernes scorpioides]
MKLLHRAASRLVADRMPDGARLGLVQFSTAATVLADLTAVGPDTRPQLLTALPRQDNGGTTAIGKGLLAALQVRSPRETFCRFKDDITLVDKT